MTTTTKDAKLFLSEYFPDLDEGGWKRKSKRKNEDGQWVREFEHSQGNKVSLIESQGQFSVLGGEAVVGATTTLFSEEELQGARALLNEFRKHQDSRSEDDYVESSPLRTKFAHALPGVMSFYFPPDTYENPEQSQSDPNMPTKGLTITFFETGKGVMDGGEYYYQWMIPSHCLPKLDHSDETNFEILDDEGSVSQFIQMMSERGFTYDHEECLFGHAMPQLTTARPAATPKARTPASTGFALRNQAMAAIEQDDVDVLASLLGAELTWLTPMGDERTLLEFAIDQNAKACFDFMLANAGDIPQDIQNHAYMNLHGDTPQDPEQYYLPLISGSWPYGAQPGKYTGNGDSIVYTAIRMAMEPLGKTLTVPMLDIAKAHGTPQQFAASLLNAIASEPMAMRNADVNRRVDALIQQDPSVLVQPETSPIAAMIKVGRYGMAGDWIMRHGLPVDKLQVGGKPLMDALQERLDKASSLMRGKMAQSFHIVKTNRSGQVIPDREEIDVREIPGLMARLSRAAKTPTTSRAPRP